MYYGRSVSKQAKGGEQASGRPRPKGMGLNIMQSGQSDDTLTGLTDAEAARRIKEEGYNELPSSKSRSILATAWDVVREPMFIMLFACGTI
jgi:magnesium-transporting ATPase (P-type)